MNNPFKIGDTVSCPEKDRHSGKVLHLICGACDLCKKKDYSFCNASLKDRLVVQWRSSEFGKPNKRCRYHYSELVLTDSLKVNTSKSINGLKPYKGFASNIKNLATLQLDVSSIDDEEVMPREVSPEVSPGFCNEEFFNWRIGI